MSSIKCFLTVFLLLVSSVAVAQPIQRWAATHNGTGNANDAAFDVAVDGSGNVYVTGITWSSSNNSDYTTIKYPPTGPPPGWVVNYNGSVNRDDFASALAVDDSSGCVYVTGSSSVPHGFGYNFDYCTVAYSPAGGLIWFDEYNGAGDGDDGANAVAVDNQGNVYVTGVSQDPTGKFDCTTIKYDPSGARLWVATFSPFGNGDAFGVALALDDEGNVYVAGKSQALRQFVFDYDYLVIKYRPDGTKAWSSGYNGPDDEDDFATAVGVDASGNVYVTGCSDSDTSYTTYHDWVTIGYDSTGTQLWVATHSGGPEYYQDEAHDLALDEEGNVYVTGQSHFFRIPRPHYNYLTIKYDPDDGTVVWGGSYDGSGSGNDYARAIAVTCSEVYVTGSSWGSGGNNDYVTVKYDLDGTEGWAATYSGTGNDHAYALAADGSGNVYVTGQSFSGTNYDYATVKYSETLRMCCSNLTPVVCRGKELYFSVTYTNNSGSPINTDVTFSAYAGYECDPSNVLIGIPRNRTIPTGTSVYYYYFKVPNSVQPGQYSISLDLVYGGDSYSCCMNLDIIQCSPFKTGDNTTWELVEAERPEVALPVVTELYQNYPNPFNATTSICYQLAEGGNVSLKVYDITGRLVETLVEGYRDTGEHEVTWDASQVSSGIYFYKLQDGGFTETKRMTLLK